MPFCCTPLVAEGTGNMDKIFAVVYSIKCFGNVNKCTIYTVVIIGVISQYHLEHECTKICSPFHLKPEL